MLGGQVHPLTLSLIWGLKLIIKSRGHGHRRRSNEARATMGGAAWAGGGAVFGRAEKGATHIVDRRTAGCVIYLPLAGVDGTASAPSKEVVT